MSKYNPLYNTIWTSNKFIKLTLKEKFIFLYLLTNERITQTGIYTIAPKHIACDTEINLQEVDSILETLEANKLIKFWHEDNLIFIIDNFKFARNTIRNALILTKTIEAQKNLHKNEELWQLFEDKYHAELEVINQALMNQQSNKNNSLHNNHNKIYEGGV